jgi:hypothetical protein
LCKPYNFYYYCFNNILDIFMRLKEGQLSAKKVVPYESDEAESLVKWCGLYKIPIIHLANEGKRGVVAARILKRTGIVKGASDFFIPCAKIPSLDDCLTNATDYCSVRGIEYTGQNQLARMAAFHQYIIDNIRHGLWIELKRRDKRVSKLTDAQFVFLDEMRREGYAAHCCWGADEAIAVIRGYLK